MRIWITLLGLALAVPATSAWAQEAPTPAPSPAGAPEEKAPAPDEDTPPADPEAEGTDANGAETPAEGANAGPRVIKAGNEEEVRVLQPQDVPNEMLRVKSKADIKAEITLNNTEGRPVVFKGVVRNGKLIERLEDSRFVPQQALDHPHCGVRIWWSGGSDGYIFFRYTSIKSITLTGKLSDAERAEIMRRLKAKREGKSLEDEGKQAAPAPDVEPILEKLTLAELEQYLVKKYPAEQGWDQKRYRDLKRRQLIENQILSREEATFVQYFNVLAQIRFREIKRANGALTVEPGKAAPDPAPGQPGAGTPPSPPPSTVVPPEDENENEDEPLPEADPIPEDE